MPLEPVDNTAAEQTPAAPNALEAALLFKPEATEPKPAETTAPAAAVTEPKPAETPAPKKEHASPLDELEDDETSASGSLPIDEEEKPEEGEPKPEKKDKAAYRFEELTKENKTFKAQLAEKEQEIVKREARIKELEGVSNELEELRSMKDTYEKEMSVAKLEKTEAYQKAVAEPFRKIETAASKLAGRYGIDENKLFQAFAESDEDTRNSSISDLISGLDVPAADLYKLYKLADDAQPVFEEQDRLRSNAQAALAELKVSSEKETAAQAAARAEERGREADVVAKRISDKIPFAKPFVDEVLEKVKGTDLESQSVTEKVYNALAGATYPKLVKKHVQLQADYDEALAELAAFKKTTPRVGDRLHTSAPGETGRPKDLTTALLQGLGHA